MEYDLNMSVEQMQLILVASLRIGQGNLRLQTLSYIYHFQN